MAFVVIWLAIQVLVPAYALIQQRPARLGWQMYTSVTELPTVAIRRVDGSEQAIDLAGMVARDRAEADYAAAVRQELCLREGVATVIIVSHGEREVTPCE